MKKNRTRLSKYIIRIFVILAVTYSALLIPGPESPIVPPGTASPFLWNQDEYWSYLESSFLSARSTDHAILAESIESKLAITWSMLDLCQDGDIEPSSPLLLQLERIFFELSPLVAVETDYLADFVELRTSLRKTIKDQSRHWDMNSAEARNRLYRLLFGTRTAVEEIELQADDGLIPAWLIGVNEPSATPAAELLGVEIHSGDILVSRGGAPTSALIARGNDYPGNFSHVALVYVDEKSGEVSIIESHIECGVAIASIEDYLRDTKLRIMILRMRSDHPAIVGDPLLPHKAAGKSLKRARTEHIPYDFAMDFKDNGKLFCSEVASDAYSQMGVTLWMGISNISSSGVRSWLATFGVKYFETQEPSDLEYDPQLRVVAEWHNPETLYKDHLDNAVIDVMLEGAERGEKLDYLWYKLPLARLAKAYSFILNLSDSVGPVPEGMDAASALKNELFSKRHTDIKNRMMQMAEDFQTANGYRPPYWELVELARRAKVELYD
ncbi:MAG: hypothetical protein GY839_21335 [candidate division Zixibacteria bacterium]|nr:hypothetical protein [candidate division Zixibacteria bacterium]